MSAKKQNTDSLHQWQGDLWRMGSKLQSLGVVLRLQRNEYEGCPEMQGIGFILSDLGDVLSCKPASLVSSPGEVSRA